MLDHRELVRKRLPKGFGVDIGCRKPSCKIGTFGIDRHPGRGIDLVCDGSDLPFDDNSLDYISAVHVLEHIPSPKHTLVEWARVLKPGGLLLLVVPDAQIDIKQGVRYWEHVAWFTKDILKGLVQSWLGFSLDYFEARQDLKDGPMLFYYGRKPNNFTKPRMPII